MLKALWVGQTKPAMPLSLLRELINVHAGAKQTKINEFGPRREEK